MTNEEIIDMARETILQVHEIYKLDRLIRLFDIEELRAYIFSMSFKGYFDEMLYLLYFVTSERIKKLSMNKQTNLSSASLVILTYDINKINEESKHYETLKVKGLDVAAERIQYELKQPHRIFKEPKQKYTCHGKRKSW